ADGSPRENKAAATGERCVLGLPRVSEQGEARARTVPRAAPATGGTTREATRPPPAVGMRQAHHHGGRRSRRAAAIHGRTPRAPSACARFPTPSRSSPTRLEPP